jgi:hypothetical protein
VLATVMTAVRKTAGKLTSAARIAALEQAKAAHREAVAELRDVERRHAALLREVAAADAARRKLPTPVDLSRYPSFAEAQARANRRAGLESELRIAAELVGRRAQGVADAERAAVPLSSAAGARLRQLAADIAVDEELRAVGIAPCMLMQSQAGREHLVALAAEYGIGETGR